MITSIFFLYFTIFLSLRIGIRIAMTRIKTEAFLIMVLTLWILIKNME
jgi:hypothetical protein